MASFEYFCDEVGISLSDLNSMKAGKGDEIVVVKKELESLKNGFVFGMRDELMVEEKKVSCRRNVIEKMREIVCKFFVYEKSVKAFENRLVRVIAARKRGRKVGKEQVGQLMEKCFCECERLHTENVDEASTSEMRQSDVVKNLKMKVEVLERKFEENRGIKDALREVSEEKKMLVEESEVEKKRVDELVMEVEMLKAEKKVKCMQLQMMKKKERSSKVLVEKIRTKSTKRLKRCRELGRRLAVKEKVEVKFKAEKEYKLREKELRKQLGIF